MTCLVPVGEVVLERSLRKLLKAVSISRGVLVLELTPLKSRLRLSCSPTHNIDG